MLIDMDTLNQFDTIKWTKLIKSSIYLMIGFGSVGFIYIKQVYYYLQSG